MQTRPALALLLLLAAAILALWLRQPPQTGAQQPLAAPASPRQPASGPQEAIASNKPVPAPGLAPSRPPPASPVTVTTPRPQPQAESPARLEADAIALNLRHYGQRFGGNPVGTNAEIVKALNGGNPKGVRYLPQNNLRFNDQGELIDSWGTPYFFHQISSQQMEIRSAGPDKTLWTGDDMIAQ